MKIIILLFSIIVYFSFGVIIAEGAIYTWTDKDGISHFSDHAAVGTQKFSIKKNNIVSDNNKQKKAGEDNIVSGNLANVHIKKIITYQVNFTSPQNDQAIRANNGNFSVNVVITPQQNQQHKLQLYIDGIKFGSAQLSTTISAKNVDRGTHKIQVFLLDEKESILAKTKMITIHILKVSTINAPYIGTTMTNTFEH